MSRKGVLTVLDPLNYLEETRRWGDVVAEIGRQLRIKYGLGVDPSAQNQARWAEETERLIRSGISREEAGERSARLLFPDFRTRIYAGESDTIETLLDAAKRK